MTSDTTNRSKLSRTESARLYADALDRDPVILPKPEKPNRISSLIRLLPYLRPYAWRFVFMFVVAVTAVGASVATPMVTRAVIDGPVAHKDAKGVIWLGILALTLGVTEAFLQFMRRWIVSRATIGTETGIRLDLYAKLQKLPMSFHKRWEGGQLLSRVMSDIGTVRRFLGFGLLFLIMNFVQIIVVVILLLNMYMPLGIVVMISVIPVAGLCVFMERKFLAISRRMQEQNGHLTSKVEESMQGLRVIKAFGRGDYAYQTYDVRAKAWYKTSLDRVHITSFFWTFLEVIPNLTLVVVLAVGAFAASEGLLTLGTLAAFITLLLQLIWPVSSLGFLLTMTQEAMTAADRLCDVFDSEVEIVGGEKTLLTPRGELELRNVGYDFPDGEELLHDVNLHLNPGETIALVGGTGSGKTTFTALIPRLADVTSGQVLIDGVDVRDLSLESLRQVVATAFEDPTLFSMSVRENLTLGRPEATDEEIASAVEVAQAGFVYDLPWGLDTRIGEQGMSLSGGQRQRLALARAVLTQPKILVLDDTLSALDIHTEALVEEALQRVLKGVTGIVVAHRASTVLLADKVALLQGGTITHVGTHAELLATVPDYRELLSADFRMEENLSQVQKTSQTETEAQEGALR